MIVNATRVGMKNSRCSRAVDKTIIIANIAIRLVQRLKPDAGSGATNCILTLFHAGATFGFWGFIAQFGRDGVLCNPIQV